MTPANSTEQPDLLTEFMYLAPVGMVQIALDGRVQMINPLAVQLLMPLAAKGDHLTNLFDTLDFLAPELRKMVSEFSGLSGNVINNHRIVITSGMRARSEMNVYAISIIKLDANALMATLQDVSESAQRERLMQKQEAWINLIRAGVQQFGQLIIDTQCLVQLCSQRAAGLLGYAADTIVGQSCLFLYPHDAMTLDRIGDRLKEVDHTGVSFDEGWMRRADGSEFWGHTVITPIEAALKPDCYSLVIRDITQSRESIESLLRAANSDELTGVSNRRAFYEAADLELARYARKPRPIALLLIDIDHFKQVNDTYGHLIGDEVIRNLAVVLRRSVRAIDVVARLGGEEFAVMLPSTETDMAAVVGERIRRNVAAERIAGGGKEISYTISVGVALVQPAMSGTSELIAAADAALYDAKRRGRNQVCVFSAESAATASAGASPGMQS